LSLTEIAHLPAWELEYWLIAAKRNRGEAVLDLAQAIGLALGGKIDERAIAELIPEYTEDGFDDDPGDDDLKQQAAVFFGVPIDAMPPTDSRS
jgi:hypothetical protein